MEDNPYAAPAFAESPPTGTTVVSDAEIRAFVGRNADYYLGKWPKTRGGSRRAKGFNWAALLVGVCWLVYRKMYLSASIVYATLALAVVGTRFAESAGVVTARPTSPALRFSGLAFSFLCGIFGNALYLAHAKRGIARVRAAGLQGEAYDKALARRGQTNAAASVMSLLLYIVVVGFLTLILTIVVETI
jgi:hypothetical protein